MYLSLYHETKRLLTICSCSLKEKPPEKDSTGRRVRTDISVSNYTLLWVDFGFSESVNLQVEKPI